MHLPISRFLKIIEQYFTRLSDYFTKIFCAWAGRCGGLVVSVRAPYFDDTNSTFLNQSIRDKIKRTQFRTLMYAGFDVVMVE